MKPDNNFLSRSEWTQANESENQVEITRRLTARLKTTGRAKQFGQSFRKVFPTKKSKRFGKQLFYLIILIWVDSRSNQAINLHKIVEKQPQARCHREKALFNETLERLCRALKKGHTTKSINFPNRFDEKNFFSLRYSTANRIIFQSSLCGLPVENLEIESSE